MSLVTAYIECYFYLLQSKSAPKSEDRGSKINQQAADILFPNLACGRKQKICHLAGFT